MASQATQLTYGDPAVGLPGQIYDAAQTDTVTKIAAEDIPFGVFVGFTASGTCELPDSSGEITGAAGGGISLMDHNKPAGVGYKAGDAVKVLVRGRVFVLAEEALALGDTLFARHTAGTGSQKGAFRNDNDSSSAATPAAMKVFQAVSATTAVLQVG